jgi:hypothetical protein
MLSPCPSRTHPSAWWAFLDAAVTDAEEEARVIEGKQRVV